MTIVQPSRLVALMAGCLAALGWGLTGMFVKLLPDFTTLEVLGLRLLVAVLTTLPFLSIHRPLRTQFLTLIRTPMGLGLSSLMVFYYLFAVRAFQLAPVSDVVLVVGLAPLLGLAVKLGMRQPLFWREGLGAVIAFTGLLLFVFPKLQGQVNPATYLTGLCFAFLSAWVSLGYASLFKYYATQNAGLNAALNPVAVAFTTFMLGSIITVPLAVVASTHPIQIFRQPHIGWIILGLGTLSTVIPTLCYSYAAKYLSPILTTTLNLLTPIFAALFAAWLLKETFSGLSLLGAVLILVGILTLSLPRSRPADIQET